MNKVELKASQARIDTMQANLDAEIKASEGTDANDSETEADKASAKADATAKAQAKLDAAKADAAAKLADETKLADAVKAETDRVDQIKSICTTANVSAASQNSFIDNKMSVVEVSTIVSEMTASADGSNGTLGTKSNTKEVLAESWAKAFSTK